LLQKGNVSEVKGVFHQWILVFQKGEGLKLKTKRK